MLLMQPVNSPNKHGHSLHKLMQPQTQPVLSVHVPHSKCSLCLIRSCTCSLCCPTQARRRAGRGIGIVDRICSLKRRAVPRLSGRSKTAESQLQPCGDLAKFGQLRAINQLEAQLLLLPLAEHAVQVSFQQERVLDMKSLEISAGQLPEFLNMCVGPSAQPNRSDFGTPHELVGEEIEELAEESCHGQRAGPVGRGRSGPQGLESRGWQTRQLQLHLQEVDDHERQAVRREVPERGTAHAFLLCPELYEQHEISHRWVNVTVGLQKLGVQQSAPIITGQVHFYPLFKFELQEGHPRRTEVADQPEVPALQEQRQEL
mmetsp:Transcript_60309/g.108598  ORF Transcript_60309/g.108598 Transcript_60309/m.108598 type:complete len:316 (+) Transcript_60309:80-1027(+)